MPENRHLQKVLFTANEAHCASHPSKARPNPFKTSAAVGELLPGFDSSAQTHDWGAQPVRPASLGWHVLLSDTRQTSSPVTWHAQVARSALGPLSLRVCHVGRAWAVIGGSDCQSTLLTTSIINTESRHVKVLSCVGTRAVVSTGKQRRDSVLPCWSSCSSSAECYWSRHRFLCACGDASLCWLLRKII